MLKQAINVDSMELFQSLDYYGKYIKAGKEVEDMVEC
jgi:hypothetical protein